MCLVEVERRNVLAKGSRHFGVLWTLWRAVLSRNSILLWPSMSKVARERDMVGWPVQIRLLGRRQMRPIDLAFGRWWGSGRHLFRAHT
jgi:hypothetical protein